MKEKIFSQYEQIVMGNWDSYLLPRIAELVAYAALFGVRRSWIHGHDSECNSSGSLKGGSEGLRFHLEDYSSLGAFLEEYTGNTLPSYLPGYGLMPETYRHQVDQLFTDFLSFCRESLLSYLTVEQVNFILSVLGESQEYSLDKADMGDLFEEFDFYDREIRFHEKFQNWSDHLDLAWMVRLGTPIAEQTHQRLEHEQEERKKRYELEKEKAQRLLYLLRKKYRLKHQQDLPDKIERKGPYLHRIQQLLADLAQEDLDLLFLYGPFSHSIKNEASLRHLRRDQK